VVSRTPLRELTIENKRLLYVYIAIIKLIWIYGIQLWGCTRKSNTGVIRKTSPFGPSLPIYIYIYRSKRNYTVHRDMMLLTIADEIQRFARKHETRLDHHVNLLAIIRQLHLKQYDLA